jgi:hypothetical protein
MRSKLENQDFCDLEGTEKNLYRQKLRIPCQKGPSSRDESLSSNSRVQSVSIVAL